MHACRVGVCLLTRRDYASKSYGRQTPSRLQVPRVSFNKKYTRREMQINSLKAYTPRHNSGGNFCGHNPDAPAFRNVIARLIEGTKHPLLKAAIKRLGAYYTNPGLLEKLGRILSNGDSRRKRRDGQPRKVRTERQDINLMVMAFCLSKANLMRLQVGIVPYSDPDNLYGPTESEIATAIGASLGRVQRALAHWKHAGYISITPRPRKGADGKWESVSPIICIKATVFMLIGITKEALKAAQAYQYSKWKAEREKRFQRAVKRERDLHSAKTRESNDFFVQDLLRRVGELPQKQKAWQARNRAGPPKRPHTDSKKAH